MTDRNISPEELLAQLNSPAPSVVQARAKMEQAKQSKRQLSDEEIRTITKRLEDAWAAKEALGVAEHIRKTKMFLAASRSRPETQCTFVFYGNHPKAGQRCTQLRVKGLDVCRHHGGRAKAEAQMLARGRMPKRLRKLETTRQGYVAIKAAMAGQLSPVLMEYPAFKAALAQLYAIGLAPLVPKQGWRVRENSTEAGYLRTQELLRVVGLLAAGWTQMEIDPARSELWAQAVQSAKEAGLA